MDATTNQSVSGRISATSLPREWLWRRRDVLCRAGLVILFAIAVHQLRWETLRFITSETVLRLSKFLNIRGSRVSLDVIELQGQQFRYGTSCTFVDVFIASIPILWNVKASLSQNVARGIIAGTALFLFNSMRLETAVLLYIHSVPWTIADGLLGGCSYFIVWLVIWWQRTWCLVEALDEAASDHTKRGRLG